MSKDAISKAALTRKMNVLAGARLPLPGQNRETEADLRGEIAASFEPQGYVEMRWVSDIAYCEATIMFIKAMIAAIRMHQMAEVHEQLTGPDNVFLNVGFDQVGRPEAELAALDEFAKARFIGPWKESWLDNPDFATLLGRVNRNALDQLRLLQNYLYDETKERDRLINQFEGRRRRQMRDIIALAEEKRREEMFRALTAKRVGKGEDTGGAVEVRQYLPLQPGSGADLGEAATGAADCELVAAPVNQPDEDDHASRLLVSGSGK
jgi:hypothetical protein